MFRAIDPRLGRWFSTDPVTKHHLSPYNSMSNNPLARMDPLGDDDFFSLDGKYLYSDNKKTDYVRVVLRNGKAYKLTSLQIPFKGKKGHISQTALLSIVNHYAEKNEAKFVTEGVDVMKFSRSKNEVGIYVKKNFNEDVYRIHPILETGKNIKNVFIHEDVHAEDEKKDLTYVTVPSEIKAVMEQINDPTFSETTDEFKEFMVEQFGGYFLTEHGEEFRKEFEDKTGYTLERTDNNYFKYERKQKK